MFESLNVGLICVVAILMSGKLAILAVLIIKVCWNKDYDVIDMSLTSTKENYYVTQITF